MFFFFFYQVLVIIDVKPKDLGLPTEAYISVEEIHDVSQITSAYQYDAMRVKLKLFCHLGPACLNSRKDDIMYYCVMVLLHLLVLSTLH